MRRRGCQAEEEEEARNKDESRPKLIANKEEKNFSRTLLQREIIGLIIAQRLLEASLCKSNFFKVSFGVEASRREWLYSGEKEERRMALSHIAGEQKEKEEERQKNCPNLCAKRRGGSKAQAQGRSERERRKDFSRLAFPEKRAILFIDKKILSFALTFHDFFSREASIQKSENRPETSWIFFYDSQKFHWRMKNAFIFQGFFLGKDEEAP